MIRMLKKPPFSPAQPRRTEMRLFPYIVLASLRGSEVRGGYFPFAKIHSTGERPHKVRVGQIQRRSASIAASQWAAAMQPSGFGAGLASIRQAKA